MQESAPSVPCASSEPVRFRSHIGEEGIGLMKGICRDRRFPNHPKNRKKPLRRTHSSPPLDCAESQESADESRHSGFGACETKASSPDREYATDNSLHPHFQGFSRKPAAFCNHRAFKHDLHKTAQTFFFLRLLFLEFRNIPCISNLRIRKF